MPLTLADVEQWDPQSVRDVATALNNRAGSMDEIKIALQRLPINGTWSGQAADAARGSLDALASYLENNAAAHQESAKALAQAASEIEGVQQLFRHVQDFAQGKFAIDLVTGSVTPLTEEVSASDRDYVVTTLSQILAAGKIIDSELAHGLNLLDGIEPASTTIFDGKPVGTAARRNEIAAFQQVFGREPTSPSDWRTAAMLDPHNYDPKYKGVPPEIVAARIKPIPGKGIVRINAFIPNDRVWNFGHDLGDNRGFDPNALPEHSRGSVIIDYDNGIVVTRQNPSVSQESGNVAVAKPHISVVQAADGTLDVRYDMADGFIPGGATTGGLVMHNVAGEIAIKPTDTGFRLGGHVTDFPALEVYHDNSSLYQYMPSMGYNEAGPVVQLMTQHSVGDPGLLDQFATHKFIPHGTAVAVPVPGVELGPVTNIPTVPVR
ncbi:MULTISPECIES: WXG100 family type VII secretion target [unclassified Mycolicibacterium]|uniref:WXG100 family type VII secretion target n=1 Tax=unclassified Mycolicibacterium TaxID=2636767 RepID=UPI002EDA185B